MSVYGENAAHKSGMTVDELRHFVKRLETDSVPGNARIHGKVSFSGCLRTISVDTHDLCETGVVGTFLPGHSPEDPQISSMP